MCSKGTVYLNLECNNYWFQHILIVAHLPKTTSIVSLAGLTISGLLFLDFTERKTSIRSLIDQNLKWWPHLAKSTKNILQGICLIFPLLAKAYIAGNRRPEVKVGGWHRDHSRTHRVGPSEPRVWCCKKHPARHQALGLQTSAPLHANQEKRVVVERDLLTRRPSIGRRACTW